MPSYIALPACASSLFFCLMTASAQLLTNGGFELPSLATNTFNNAPPTGWTVAPTSGLIMNGSAGNPAVWQGPYQNYQYYDIGDNTNMWLAQVVILPASGQYRLTWADNTGIDFGAPTQHSPYTVSVLNNESQVVVSTNFDACHSGLWQKQSLLLELSASSYTLKFSPQGDLGWLDTLIDDVQIEPNIVVHIQPSVDICWNSQTNINYQVQFHTRINTNDWVNLGSLIQGNGSTNCITDEINSQEKRFYRVVALP